MVATVLRGAMGLAVSLCAVLLALIHVLAPFGLGLLALPLLLSVLASRLLYPRWYLALAPVPVSLVSASVWGIFLRTADGLASEEWRQVLLRGLVVMPLVVAVGVYLGNALARFIYAQPRDKSERA